MSSLLVVIMAMELPRTGASISKSEVVFWYCFFMEECFWISCLAFFLAASALSSFGVDIVMKYNICHAKLNFRLGIKSYHLLSFPELF